MNKFVAHAIIIALALASQSQAAKQKKRSLGKIVSNNAKSLAVENKSTLAPIGIASTLPKKGEGEGLKPTLAAAGDSSMGLKADSVGASTVVLPKSATDNALGASAIVKLGQASINDDPTTKADERTNFTIESYVGLTYKLNKQNTLGYRHYMMGNFEAEQVDNENKQSFLRLNNSFDAITEAYTSELGLLGSTPVTSTFFLLAPGNDKGAIDKKYRFGLRYDAQPTWQITPKVAVSYYFSPRFAKYEENDFEGTHSQDIVKLIHFGEMDYSISDSFVIYGTAGYTNIFQAHNFSYTDETANLALGANFVLGKLLLNPEIDKDVVVVKGKDRQASANLWTSENVALVLTGALTF